jgi:hypothetical protein
MTYLRREHRLRMIENMIMRRTFGLEREDMKGS